MKAVEKKTQGTMLLSKIKQKSKDYKLLQKGIHTENSTNAKYSPGDLHFFCFGTLFFATKK